MNVSIRTKRGTPVRWKADYRPYAPEWDKGTFFMAKGVNCWILDENGQSRLVWIGAVETVS